MIREIEKKRDGFNKVNNASSSKSKLSRWVNKINLKQLSSEKIGEGSQENEIEDHPNPDNTVYDGVVDAIVITDSNLIKPGPRILYVNPQFTKMTGYKPDDVIGKSPRILQGPKTDRKVLDELKEKLKKGLGFDGKTVNYRKDGSEFYLHWNISPIRDKKGNIINYMSIQRDVTENMRMEQDLIKREDQFRLMAEFTDDIVSLHGIDGSYLYCSPSMGRTLGYKSSEIVGKSPFDLFHQKDINKGKLGFELLSISRKVSTHTFRMKHKDGHYLWIEAKIKPVMGDNDKVDRYVVSSKDITEEKAARSELKLQQAYFKQLFDSSPEGVVMLDNKDQIVNANMAFQDLFQYSINDMKGENINDLIVPEHNPITNTIYRAVGDNAHQIETVRKRKDGSLVNVSIVGAPIEYNNKLVGVYGIYRDITLQKKDEYIVKQSLKEKEVLLQEIHHRVKNNMQIISSLHNLQANHIKDKNTLALFKESQNRVQAMALVHDQLYQSSDLARINFGNYLQDLMHQLFASFGKNGVGYTINSDQVSFNINQAVPCGLIVNELVTNSLKHAFKEGQTGKIEINLREIDEDYILLEVTDDGVGFPPEVDFRKTSSSLGLQLVNGLVGQVKGQINLSSDNETRFSIRLPK
ncbi:MAG: PAS domain S-box protein [Balneolales bacterium]